MEKIKHVAIAITRTCGSGGGSHVGKSLAKRHGIDVYDRKLLRLASDSSGISEAIFAGADENTKKTLLYRASRRVYNGEAIPPESGNFTSDENLFRFQAQVLRELLEHESYVCIGRAADYVLRDKPGVVSVYLSAPYEYRVQREMCRQGLEYNEAERYINRLDKYRNAYYIYHTGRRWDDPANYNLCLDTAALGLDNCVALIEEYIRLKFGAVLDKEKERGTLA